MYPVIILFTVISLSISYLKFPFKRCYMMTPKTEEDFALVMYHNYLGVELEVGHPNQKVILNLWHNEYSTSLFGEKIFTKQNVSKFNESLSTSYQEIDKEKIDFEHTSIYFEGKRASDTFGFLDKKIDNFPFLLSERMRATLEVEVNHGVIGLDIQTKQKDLQDYNFIKQLKKHDLIEGYPFTLKYTGKDEGEFIIGKYPHEYDPKNYKPELFKKTYAQGFGENALYWALVFDKITYGELDLTNSTFFSLSYFSFEQGLIISPADYFINVTKDFFEKYVQKGLCSNIKIRYGYSVFSCKKTSEVKLEELKEVSFYSSVLNYTFTLTYKELFEEFQGRNYFLVTSQTYYNRNPWKFGAPFFKKYQVVFQPDSKEIGFYIPIQKGPPGPFNWYKFWVVLLSIIILILFVVIIQIIRKTIQKRKKRATELLDEYEYSSVNESK